MSVMQLLRLIVPACCADSDYLVSQVRVQLNNSIISLEAVRFLVVFQVLQCFPRIKVVSMGAHAHMQQDGVQYMLGCDLKNQTCKVRKCQQIFHNIISHFLHLQLHTYTVVAHVHIEDVVLSLACRHEDLSWFPKNGRVL